MRNSLIRASEKLNSLSAFSRARAALQKIRQDPGTAGTMFEILETGRILGCQSRATFLLKGHNGCDHGVSINTILHPDNSRCETEGE